MSIGNTRRATTLLTFIGNDVTTATKTGSAVDLRTMKATLLFSLDAEAGGRHHLRGKAD